MVPVNWLREARDSPCGCDCQVTATRHPCDRVDRAAGDQLIPTMESLKLVKVLRLLADPQTKGGCYK
jgi:hypothetical protein